MRIFLVFLFSVVLCFAGDSSIVGSVEKTKGSVKVKNKSSIKKSRVRSGFKISKGDLIITSKGAFAKIRLSDSSEIILDESSTISFDSAYNLKQKKGKIYYKITSRDAKNSLSIKTPFAIIGIKGTTFIINTTEHLSLSLKEGIVGIESIKEEFELYRKKVQKEFEDFMAQQYSAYEEYKQVQRPGFAEKTKSFDLHEGKTISFDGNKAIEEDWSKKDDDEFEYFKDIVNSMK